MVSKKILFPGTYFTALLKPWQGVQQMAHYHHYWQPLQFTDREDIEWHTLNPEPWTCFSVRGQVIDLHNHIDLARLFRCRWRILKKDVCTLKDSRALDPRDPIVEFQSIWSSKIVEVEQLTKKKESFQHEFSAAVAVAITYAILVKNNITKQENKKSS